MSVFRTLRIPVALAPMAGVNTPEMAAKACGAGILGSLGAGMMSPEALRAAVTQLRTLAPGRPFNVNLFVVDERPAFSDTTGAEALSWVTRFCQEQQLPVPNAATALAAPYAPSFAAQFDELLALRPPTVSFTFGLVSPERIAQCHARGIEVWGTATTIAEARQWRERGADAVVLQGIEAGGHRGSLSTGAQPSGSPLDELVRSARTELDGLPFIVAGGVMDGAQVRALVEQGAAGVQVGTLFMGAADSPLAPAARRALYGECGVETRLTRGVTGRWARGLATELVRASEHVKPLPYPAQNKLTQPLRAAGAARGDHKALAIWAGVNFGRCRPLPIDEIVSQLVQEYAPDKEAGPAVEPAVSSAA